ncbi:hypothetical protein [Citricoccus nitrophenolicus]|uniref:hypothetical protein n=1 Tax=Citricoccus nitrophenolicus TaxID=863575 RepID=UPI0031F0CE96
MSTTALGYISLRGIYRGVEAEKKTAEELRDLVTKRFEAEGYWSLYQWIRDAMASVVDEDEADGVPEWAGAGRYFDRAYGATEAAIAVTPYGVRSLEEHFYRRWEREQVWEAAKLEAWSIYPVGNQRLERANHIIGIARERLAHDPEGRDFVIRGEAGEWNLDVDLLWKVTDDAAYLHMPFPPGIVPENLNRREGYLWYRALDSDVAIPMRRGIGTWASEDLAIHPHPELREHAADSRDLPMDLLTMLANEDSDAVVRATARRNQHKRSQGAGSR